jgi:hypothetical protein
MLRADSKRMGAVTTSSFQERQSHFCIVLSFLGRTGEDVVGMEVAAEGAACSGPKSVAMPRRARFMTAKRRVDVGCASAHRFLNSAQVI